MTDDGVKIAKEVWMHLFGVVLLPLCEHIADILETSSQGVPLETQLKHMVLVGGLSESKYVRQVIEEQFADSMNICPTLSKVK